MSEVGIVSCKEYEKHKVEEAIAELVLHTDFPDVKGKKVLIKPNILSDSAPEKAITTNPMVLQAVIDLVKREGAKEIFVGDSPAMPGKNFTPKVSQLADLCTDNVKWVDFTINPVKRNIEFVNRKIAMASITDEVDIVICVAKFKTHTLMYATGAIKNMFGLVPGKVKSLQHVHHPSRVAFGNMICGIFKQAKVDYAFMDGIIGMEGAGPANGEPRNVGLMLGSTDALALDISQAIIMGYDPYELPILAIGMKEGITQTTAVHDVSYPCLDARKLVISDFKRIEIKKENKDMMDLKPVAPVFHKETCIQCMKCVKICPAKALHLEGKQVVIDEAVCIRCYCCHEVCPVGAITVD